MSVQRFWFNAGFLAASLGTLPACEPRLVVGDWTCPQPGEDGGAPANPGGLIELPWSAGFERGICDYTRVSGFCYAFADADYATVSSPVHTGRFAAAFHVSNAQGDSDRQTRCVRPGEFPTEAYYSAWYFVPEVHVNPGNWNLFHYQGGAPNNLHGLWDVSLSSSPNGELSLYALNFLNGQNYGRGETPPIPIRAWFQIGVFWRRAADATGELSVYQDGQRIIRVTDIITDDTNWGQWYVGNYASNLMPPDSTLYVDDVMIREGP